LSNNKVMRCQKSSISTALSETGFQAGWPDEFAKKSPKT
jgi:hypothetical protein